MGTPLDADVVSRVFDSLVGTRYSLAPSGVDFKRIGVSTSTKPVIHKNIGI
jgi:hypothetical protein